jgi:hypothetical protein
LLNLESVAAGSEFLTLEALSHSEGVLLCPTGLDCISFITSDCDFICREVCGAVDGKAGEAGGDGDDDGSGSMADSLLIPRNTVIFSRSLRDGLVLCAVSCELSSVVTTTTGSDEGAVLRESPCQKLEFRGEENPENVDGVRCTMVGKSCTISRTLKGPPNPSMGYFASRERPSAKPRSGSA